MRTEGSDSWERDTLREIEQMRTVLGISRQHCSLSDAAAGRLWMATLIIAVTPSLIFGAPLVLALVGAVGVMWLVGLLWRH